MRVYVSGPMSGYPGHNFPAFNAAARELARAGFETCNPADKGIIPGWSWEDYLRVDIIEMLGCDGVATLAGWNLSEGALLETQVANACGLRVEPLSKWLFLGRESFEKPSPGVEAPARFRSAGTAAIEGHH